jgi:CubicO group peptidase (beta-lactamase class C family)
VPVQEMATTEQFLAVFDGHPMKHEPGERFVYCNGGFILLALLAERAAGVPFYDLVDQRVCRPAGLSDTLFLRSDELPGRAAAGYRGEIVRPRSDAPELSMRYGLGFWLYAATGAVSLHGFDAAVGFVTVRYRDRGFTSTVFSNQSRGGLGLDQPSRAGSSPPDHPEGAASSEYADAGSAPRKGRLRPNATRHGHPARCRPPTGRPS